MKPFPLPRRAAKIQSAAPVNMPEIRLRRCADAPRYAFAILLGALALLPFLEPQSLQAQSYGGGAMYSSFLPLGSAYNELETKNSATGVTSRVPRFKFGKKDVIHYSPGGALSFVYALSGLLMSADIGIMGGPGPDKSIPDFPVRPFLALNFGGKFVEAGIFSLYGVLGFYGDFAVGKGKNNYDFFHAMAFFRAGPGISLKLPPRLEFFVQVQLGIGIQGEQISLESKAGNTISESFFFMVPVALFPELGIRIWS